MNEPVRPARLLIWSLATFHTAFFFAVLVVLLYLSGQLRNLLASLNTLVGTAVYGVLWITTWWCTHRAYQQLRWIELATPLNFLELIGVAIKWGAVNGVFFLILASILLAMITIVGIPFAIVALIIGSPIALLIGALVGFLFALIDYLVIETSRHILDWIQQRNIERSLRTTAT